MSYNSSQVLCIPVKHIRHHSALPPKHHHAPNHVALLVRMVGICIDAHTPPATAQATPDVVPKHEDNEVFAALAQVVCTMPRTCSHTRASQSATEALWERGAGRGRGSGRDRSHPPPRMQVTLAPPIQRPSRPKSSSEPSKKTETTRKPAPKRYEPTHRAASCTIPQEHQPRRSGQVVGCWAGQPCIELHSAPS